jgi:hypothetical protein
MIVPTASTSLHAWLDHRNSAHASASGQRLYLGSAVELPGPPAGNSRGMRLLTGGRAGKDAWGSDWYQ